MNFLLKRFLIFKGYYLWVLFHTISYLAGASETFLKVGLQYDKKQKVLI